MNNIYLIWRHPTIKIHHVLLYLQKTKTEHENNPASKGQKTL